jgi:hypothetical protein
VTLKGRPYKNKSLMPLLEKLVYSAFNLEHVSVVTGHFVVLEVTEVLASDVKLKSRKLVPETSF